MRAISALPDSPFIQCVCVYDGSDIGNYERELKLAVFLIVIIKFRVNIDCIKFLLGNVLYRVDEFFTLSSPAPDELIMTKLGTLIKHNFIYVF